MELLEYHFNTIDGNLFYDEITEKYEMFSSKGKALHLNYLTFKKLFEKMKSLKNAIILESGIASSGTNSTYLFNEYVKKYGGRFWSVDINSDLVKRHQNYMCPATQLVCNDSISFFTEWSKENKAVDVIYLDSYDLDFYNPTPSATHGLGEYKALVPVIKKNTLLLIDDTPSSPYWLDDRSKLYDDMNVYYSKYGFLPGKGMSVINEIQNATILLHNYQILFKFF